MAVGVSTPESPAIHDGAIERALHNRGCECLFPLSTAAIAARLESPSP